MKKILFILATIILGISGCSQKEVSMVSAFSLTVDTLTNTSTIYMTVPRDITGNYVAAFSTTITNISGTSAGTAWLQESVNGNGYSTWSTTDTLSISDGATKVWKLTYTPCKSYRIKYTGTGTQSTSIIASTQLNNV